MKARISRRSLWLAALISSTSVLPQAANATIVEFETVMGTFQVNLYDNDTPATVANFLDYVNNGAYNDSIFHRSVPGFVVQGGGFTFVSPNVPDNPIPANPSVINEPVFANVRGTIAMAKTGAGPSTATNQWFFNLSNNTANLDNQNGGFTVFGEVVGNGMAVVDDIAALPTFNLGFSFGFGGGVIDVADAGAYTDVPLQGDTTNSPPNETNYVIVTAVTIFDSDVDSAAGLNPPLSTATSGGTTPPPSSGGGGGGSFGFLSLFALLLAYRNRKLA